MKMILNKSTRIILYISYTFLCTYPSIAAEGGSGGMPQMVIPDFMPQLVWLFIIFPILYCSMKYLALPRITEIMANRDMQIISNINKAEEIRNKIEKANKEHELAIKETNARIKVLVSEISQKSITEAEQQMQECQNKINIKIKEEKLKLEKEINSFSEDVEKISNNAAKSIIEKIYYKKPNSDNLKKIVSKYSESYKND
jgi:F-type H+-transporting ATPase subunit b